MFLPISRFGRRFFDFDNFRDTALDVFDPFDDRDMFHHSGAFPSLFWVRDPHTNTRRQPEKFRVTMNVAGYDKEQVTAKIDGRQLRIAANNEEKQTNGDFNTKSFQKSFEIPSNAKTDQMTSFITPTGVLVVEIPLEVKNHSDELVPAQDGLFNFDQFFSSSFLPKVVDAKNGKALEMSVDLKDFNPKDVQVNLKDNELIVRAQSRSDGSQSHFKSFYYKQLTLPPGTDLENLTSIFNEGKLEIKAPYKEPELQKMLTTEK